MEKNDVLYLCDGYACKRCHPEDCQHTSDITHAVKFVKYRINETKNAYIEYDDATLMANDTLSIFKKEIGRMRKETENGES